MIKIIFENCMPCPLDSSIMCENSKLNSIDNLIDLSCNAQQCDRFTFYKIEDEIIIKKC